MHKKLLLKLSSDLSCFSPALKSNDNDVPYLLHDLPSGETVPHAEGS